MSNRQLSPVARELIAAKKRIENIENWCPEGQGRAGKNEHRICALLALGELPTSNRAYNRLSTSAVELFGFEPGRAIIDVNRLGHAAVMQLYDHAISRALAEGK